MKTEILHFINPFIMKQSSLMILFMASFPFVIFAQSLAPEVLATAGGYDTGSGATLSWTLGEISVETYSTGTSILTQGFHQTLLNTTSTQENNIVLQLLLFPNPTTNRIFLNLKEEETLPVHLSIHSMEGKMFWSGMMTYTEFEIDMEAYPDGLYLLSIRDEKGQCLKTLKIFKAY